MDIFTKKPVIFLLGGVQIILLTVLLLWFMQYQKGTDFTSDQPPIDVPKAISSEELSKLPSGTGPTATSCRRTGCGGDICADQDIVSTCEVRPEAKCFQGAECTRQADGSCGFTLTDAVQKCLRSVEVSSGEVMRPSQGASPGAPEPW